MGQSTLVDTWRGPAVPVRGDEVPGALWEARAAKDAGCGLPNTSSTGLFCLMAHKTGKGRMCMDDTRL